jgi:hypothetical protein
MNNSLDISIHGPQRVAIVEQLVHICRYTPGLVLLEGDAGKSPVNFLRDMADLLRDELDFALLDNNHCEISFITTELVSQWYIYQSEDNEQTDVQSIHHYLDIGLQSGRLALIVIERASLLTDEAINFLVSMMARHSRLTVLFAGIFDARPLLRRAQQAEVPVHRIDMPDASDSVSPNLASSNFDHTFSDDSYAVPDDDAFEDDLYEPDFLVAEPRGKREPVIGRQSAATQSSIRISTSDSVFGMSTHLSAVQAWGAATLAGIRKKKSGGALLLMVGFLTLVLLLLLMAIDSRDSTNNAPALLESAESLSAPPVIVAPVATTTTVAVPVVAAPATVAATTALEPAEHSVTPAQVIENKVVADPAPVIPEQTKAEAVAKVISSTERQWRAKPANYTIQVAAAHSEKNIRELAAKLPVSSPYLVYQARRDGKPWFVLIYGSFTTKQAAAVARDSLAVDLKKNSTPWVRKQGEIFAQ